MNSRTLSLPLLALLLVIGGCVSRAAPSVVPTARPSVADFPTQLARYVEIQEALALDRFQDAKERLEEFSLVTDSSTQALIRPALEANDIEELRAEFKPVSEFFSEADLPQGFARAYCPMYDSGSFWVQRSGPVRNPYYGAAMLTCGVVDAATGAHMDHTPRHGGTVFMAPDSFHHIEGTYPQPGVFRLYATDNYREPVDISTWAGRAVTAESYDETTDEYVELVAFELTPSPNGDYLEASIPNAGFPAELAAKVIFQDDFPAERFDFIFAELSASGTSNYTDVASGGAPDTIPLAQRIMPNIPASSAQIAIEIAVRAREIQQLIARGSFTEIFIPALQGKELALALQRSSSTLSTTDRNRVRIAVRHLVRAAYLLDWYGDLGNRNDVARAYLAFDSAVEEISSVYKVPTTP